eukprot:GHVP01013286.1.p1 GENE.GHVP01013286.1~~GHVP01013286.1.p1  ORF type:complete len:118 (+),score=3.22 GHVP01013286.1:596-949(+)
MYHLQNENYISQFLTHPTKPRNQPSSFPKLNIDIIKNAIVRRHKLEISRIDAKTKMEKEIVILLGLLTLIQTPTLFQKSKNQYTTNSENIPPATPHTTHRTIAFPHKNNHMTNHHII